MTVRMAATPVRQNTAVPNGTSPESPRRPRMGTWLGASDRVGGAASDDGHDSRQGAENADGRRRPELNLAANDVRDGQNEQGEGENGRRLIVEL